MYRIFLLVVVVSALWFPALAHAGLSSDVVNNSSFVESGAVYETVPVFGVPLSVGSTDGVIIDTAAAADTSRSYTLCHAAFGDTYLSLDGVPIRDGFSQTYDLSLSQAALQDTITWGFRYFALGYGDTINVPLIVWPDDADAVIRDVITVRVYEEIDANTLRYITDLPLPERYNTLSYAGFRIDTDVNPVEKIATYHVVVTMPEQYAYTVYPRIRVCDLSITGVNVSPNAFDPDTDLQTIQDMTTWQNVDSGDVYIADPVLPLPLASGQTVGVIPTATKAAGINIYDEGERLNSAWDDSAPAWVPIAPNFATPLQNYFEFRFARGDTRIPTINPVGVRMMVYSTTQKMIHYSNTWICPPSSTPSWWPSGTLYTTMCRITINDVIQRFQETTGLQFNWSSYGVGYGCPKQTYNNRVIICSPSVSYQSNMIAPPNISHDTRPASWIVPFVSGFIWQNLVPNVRHRQTATAVARQNTPTATTQIIPTAPATFTARPITPTGVTAATRTQLAKERATQTKIAIDLNATQWAGATRIVGTATARVAATRTAGVAATSGANATATAYKQSLSTQVAAAKTSAAATVTRAVRVDEYDALAKQDPAKNMQDAAAALAGTDTQVGISAITGAFTALQNGLNSSPCSGLPLPYVMNDPNPAIRITGFNTYIGNGLCMIRTWLETDKDRQPWAFIRGMLSLMLTVGFVWVLIKWMTRER